MKHFYLFTWLAVILIWPSSAAWSRNPSGAIHSIAQPKLFIPNQGQWPAEVLFLAQTPGSNLWITKSGFTQQLYSHEQGIEHGQVVRLTYDKSQTMVTAVGNEASAVNYSYFVGNNMTQHAANVPLYHEALVRNLYPGVDLRYYFDGTQVRFDYNCSTASAASAIAFRLSGCSSVAITEAGDLRYDTRFGAIALKGLQSYAGKDRRLQASRFVVNDQRVSIQVQADDPSAKLVIDPLIWATFCGGSGDDFFDAIAASPNGQFCVTGRVRSSDFPIVTGAYDTTLSGLEDVIVSWFNATGTALLHSTFLGSSGFDFAHQILVDNSNNVFVVGSAESSNFPFTAGSFDPTYNGGGDAFAAKLNATGSTLLFAGSIGGGSDEMALDACLDSQNNLLVAGYTTSEISFTTTPGTYVAPTRDSIDAFVMRITNDGDSVLQSMRFGGWTLDEAFGVAVDPGGYIYITGRTESNDLPVSVGAAQSVYADQSLTQGEDAFVAKFSPQLDSLIYCTYVGGYGVDQVNRIAVDQQGNACIVGTTFALDFPLTANAVDTSSQGGSEGFITRLNATGTARLFSTYMGASSMDYVSDVKYSATGKLYVCGSVSNGAFPVTPNAYDNVYNGNDDGYICRFNTSGQIENCTYLGGASHDEIRAIVVAAADIVTGAGLSMSSNFPISPTAYDTTLSPWSDPYVAQLDMSSSVGVEDLSSGANVEAYPNPTSNFLRITVPESHFSGTAHLTIFDIEGKVQLQTAFEDVSTLVDVHLLPTGLYHYKLETDRGSSGGKFVRF